MKDKMYDFGVLGKWSESTLKSHLEVDNLRLGGLLKETKVYVRVIEKMFEDFYTELRIRKEKITTSVTMQTEVKTKRFLFWKYIAITDFNKITLQLRTSHISSVMAAIEDKKKIEEDIKKYNKDYNYYREVVIKLSKKRKK